VPPTAALAREVLEGAAGRAARRPAPTRPMSGVAGSAAGLRSREKMVWEWPDLAARVLEEWR
jgi:hypothetical protein